VHKALRTGILDTNKLAEAVQGVPTVHERRGNVTSTKVSVGILVDESGSMGGWGGSGKIDSARKAAILVAESIFKSKDFNCFIYGHTADTPNTHWTYINTYFEPGFEDLYGLGEIHAKANNRDGVAIINVAKRIRKFTDDHVILLVISDGAPNAYGYSGVEHTRQAVKDAEKMGMTVVQVAIEAELESADMFSHFVEFTDLGELANNLGKLVFSLIKKNIKYKTTY
jgi:nitric oxide reductase activation protein